MPRKAKATTETEATETKPVETPPAEAKPVRGAKTAAIKQALKTHKDKSPKEIAELLTASGIPTTAGQVSNIKSLLAAKKKAKKAADPPPKKLLPPRRPEGRRIRCFAGQSKEAGAGIGRGQGSQDCPECVGPVDGLKRTGHAATF